MLRVIARLEKNYALHFVVWVKKIQAMFSGRLLSLEYVHKEGW